jgi:hypothetical protein
MYKKQVLSLLNNNNLNRNENFLKFINLVRNILYVIIHVFLGEKNGSKKILC